MDIKRPIRFLAIMAAGLALSALGVEGVDFLLAPPKPVEMAARDGGPPSVLTSAEEAGERSLASVPAKRRKKRPRDSTDPLVEHTPREETAPGAAENPGTEFYYSADREARRPASLEYTPDPPRAKSEAEKQEAVSSFFSRLFGGSGPASSDSSGSSSSGSVSGDGGSSGTTTTNPTGIATISLGAGGVVGTTSNGYNVELSIAPSVSDAEVGTVSGYKAHFGQSAISE